MKNQIIENVNLSNLIPTWIINNKKVLGFLSLGEIKEISNYEEN